MPDSTPPPMRTAEAWRTVRDALNSWSKTARLCLICCAMNVPVDILAWLIRR